MAVLLTTLIRHRRHLAQTLLIAGLLAAPLASTHAEDAATAETPIPALTRGQIEQIVHDYLLANPEVLQEASEVLRERHATAARRAVDQALEDKDGTLFHDSADPTLGNPDGVVTMVHFFDYACGYCKAMAPALKQALTTDGPVRAQFKEFPILGQTSMVAATAALAANRQGKYAAFHQALYGFNGRLTETRIFDIAKSVGLDIDRLKRDMADPEIAAHIERNKALASKLGIQGTPAFVIGDQVYRGAMPPDILDDAIKDAVARARGDKADTNGQKG